MPLLRGRDFKTCEIALSTGSNPEGNAPRRITKFEIIHNQAWLAGAVDKQTGLRPIDRNTIACPDAWLKVHIAFIFFRRLLAGVRETKTWVSTVLRRMIASDLIIGSAVCRTQIDILELSVMKPKGHSDKAACPAQGARGGAPRQFQFDRAIVKYVALHNGIGFPIGHLAIFDDLNRPLAEIVDCLQFHLVRSQLFNGLSRRG